MIVPVVVGEGRTVGGTVGVNIPWTTVGLPAALVVV